MVRDTRVQSQVGVIPKTQKMVFDTAMLNAQHYNASIKAKMEQCRERTNAAQHFGVVAIEKRTFVSPSTTVANFTFIYIYMSVYVCIIKIFVIYSIYLSIYY